MDIKVQSQKGFKSPNRKCMEKVQILIGIFTNVLAVWFVFVNIEFN